MAPSVIWRSSRSITRSARIRPSTGSCRASTSNGTSKAAWSSWLGVPYWFSWENQGGSIAPVLTAGQHELAVLDDRQSARPEPALPVPAPGPRSGDAGLLGGTAHHWGALAIHAAVPRLGKGLMFFACLATIQVRVASPDYGNVAKGIYTSVTWDPAAPAVGVRLISPP